jgi:DNA-binding CsgD family transcriptional regulator
MSTQALHSLKPVEQRLQSNAEELVRRLVDSLGNRAVWETGPVEDSGKPVEQVLMDLDVDGARYLLIRMPQTSCCRVQLSPREQEIVRMVAKGHPNKIIADVLCISQWTVCTHLRRIFAKLGVGSRAAMVARLLEIGTKKKQPTDSSSANGLRSLIDARGVPNAQRQSFETETPALDEGRPLRGSTHK